MVEGALAASAPIFYVNDVIPRTAFFERVTKVHYIIVMRIQCF